MSSRGARWHEWKPYPLDPLDQWPGPLVTAAPTGTTYTPTPCGRYEPTTWQETVAHALERRLLASRTAAR